MPPDHPIPNPRLIDEVVALSERIQDNRELVREVASLLFRSGERPSANRIYQLIRRGSMGTVNDELGKWWDALREKLDIRVTNPNVPPALLTKQGELVGQMWDMAMAKATEEFEIIQAEAQARVDAAEVGRSDAEAQARAQKDAADTANVRREEIEQALAAERSAREAALAEVERWRQQSESVALDMERARSEYTVNMERAQAEFSAQLEAQRTALERTERQFDDMRKQNMLEIDAIRTRNVEIREALKKSEDTVVRLQDNELALHRRLNEQTGEIARLTGTVADLAARLEAVQLDRDRLASEKAGEAATLREMLNDRNEMIRQLNEMLSSTRRQEERLVEDMKRLQSELERLQVLTHEGKKE